MRVRTTNHKEKLMNDSDCKRIKEDRDYLQRELDREREDARIRDEREHQERETRRKERIEEARAAMAHANDWNDAFHKGLRLIAKECALEESLRDDPEYQPADGFHKWHETVTAARVIYSEEMQTVEAEIARIRQEALNRVGDRVEKETPNQFATAQAFRENNPQFLVDW